MLQLYLSEQLPNPVVYKRLDAYVRYILNQLRWRYYNNFVLRKETKILWLSVYKLNSCKPIANSATMFVYMWTPPIFLGYISPLPSAFAISFFSQSSVLRVRAQISICAHLLFTTSRFLHTISPWIWPTCLSKKLTKTRPMRAFIISI